MVVVVSKHTQLRLKMLVWWCVVAGLLVESSQAFNAVESGPAVTNGVLSQNSQDLISEHKEFMAPQPRYIGYCRNAHIYMWPGNSRKFWSYGYVDLMENYLKNCSLKYIFDTRAMPGDPLAKFGFLVTGVFYGIPTKTNQSCYESDYLLLNDTSGIEAIYCGTQSNVTFSTTSDYFELTFETLADSPTAQGFYVIIQSYRLCGGFLTPQFNGPLGTLESPLYPDSYPPNLRCNWYFQSMSETAVMFTCAQFQLGERIPGGGPNGTDPVCSDSLSFTYEWGRPNDTTTYCSNDLSHGFHNVYSLSTDLLVTFQTDSEPKPDVGFSCHYEFILYAD